jgi:hypothetical protein
MPRTQQDTPKRRPDPTTTSPDDDEAQTGDVSRMEEAGNTPRRAGQQAADESDEADIDETDEGEDEDLEDDEAEEPIGGRV